MAAEKHFREVLRGGCAGGAGLAGFEPGFDGRAGKQQFTGGPGAGYGAAGDQVIDLALFDPQQLGQFAGGEVVGQGSAHDAVKARRRPQPIMPHTGCTVLVAAPATGHGWVRRCRQCGCGDSHGENTVPAVHCILLWAVASPNCCQRAGSLRHFSGYGLFRS